MSRYSIQKGLVQIDVDATSLANARLLAQAVANILGSDSTSPTRLIYSVTPSSGQPYLGAQTELFTAAAATVSDGNAAIAAGSYVKVPAAGGYTVTVPG